MTSGARQLIALAGQPIGNVRSRAATAPLICGSISRSHDGGTRRNLHLRRSEDELTGGSSHPVVPMAGERFTVPRRRRESVLSAIAPTPAREWSATVHQEVAMFASTYSRLAVPFQNAERSPQRGHRAASTCQDGGVGGLDAR